MVMNWHMDELSPLEEQRAFITAELQISNSDIQSQIHRHTPPHPRLKKATSFLNPTLMVLCLSWCLSQHSEHGCYLFLCFRITPRHPPTPTPRSLKSFTSAILCYNAISTGFLPLLLPLTHRLCASSLTYGLLKVCFYLHLAKGISGSLVLPGQSRVLAA